MRKGGPALVVAPHPDDEILGVGATLARLAADGMRTVVAIVTKGQPPLFDEDFIAQGRNEALAAHELLGVSETLFLDLPAAELDSLRHRDINAALERVFLAVKPATVYVPFPGDLHVDHQRVFHSALVASRPNRNDCPKSIYAYETLSETYWNSPYLSPGFHPNVFVDVSEFLEKKIAALEIFKSQIKPFPSERSCGAARSLAALRGSNIGVHAAEAFVLVRQIV